jgi:diaminopimelate epimerase
MQFYKYQGTGNDFIIFDNRNNEIQLTKQQVATLCDRKFGIGADGLMLLQLKEGYDFEMIYYNADGGESSMCGNGGRCLVHFARHMGIVKESYNFIAIDGAHEAFFDEASWVHLKMNNVTQIIKHQNEFELNTGSPHYIVEVADIENYNVYEKGKAIRNSKLFIEKGINVNFVEQLNKGTIYVRTYERGVENETLSCGTGVTAAAIIYAHNDSGFNAVNIKTLGGDLRVEYDKLNDSTFENVWLCGPATIVFVGIVTV